jgi:7-cyano-7-deazaguanine synthase in queuosine biosynthesis
MLELNPEKQYGIMLSGGIDSAVLLYLILKTNQPKNINLIVFSIPKKDGSYLVVPDILKYLESFFEIKLKKTILVGDPEAYHADQSRTAVSEIFQKHKHIDYIFFATNQNPSRNFDYGNFKKGDYPDRVKGPPNSKILMPFIDLEKDSILKIAEENDLWDLIKLTHSCTEQSQGRCEICFQCQERAWAFSQLGIVDPGKN